MAQFLIWSFIWLGIFFLPRLLLIGVRWRNQAQFLTAHPEREWLISSYKLFLILWLPLSIVAAARILQDASPKTFYLFVAFIPLLGVGLVKSIPEMTLGIGWLYGYRKPDELTIRAPAIIYTLWFWFLQYDFHFALAERRVRWVGLVRLVINTAVLIALLIMAMR